MSKQPETSKEQVEMPTPPTKINVEGPPSLQTPLNEERNKKWDMETTTPASGILGQPRTKRQRLNPF